MAEKKKLDAVTELLFNKGVAEMPKGLCCVCGHPLSTHINENNGMFRCHALGTDLYQCECHLIKFYENDKLEEFDLKGRMEKHRKEFKEGRG